MPNRVIREGLIDSPRICGLSDFAHRLYTCLLLVVDDAGRHRGEAELVKAKALPMDSRSTEQVASALAEIESAQLCVRYTHKGSRYVQMTNYHRCGRGTISRHPFADGSFDITFVEVPTRDGLKQVVETSLVSGSDPIGIPSASHTDRKSVGADTETKTDTSTETNTKTCRARRGDSHSSYTPEFEEAWEAFRPTHRGGKEKPESFAEWKRAIRAIASRDGVDDAHLWLLSRIQSYAKSSEGNGEFSPAMVRWLKKGRYDDDESKWTAGPPGRPGTRKSVDEQNADVFDRVYGRKSNGNQPPGTNAESVLRITEDCAGERRRPEALAGRPERPDS